MSKINEFIGIDISKDTFDVWNPEIGHVCIDNSKKGFKTFLKYLSTDSWCVMEATGSYHQQLAQYLYDNNHKVSVVNPVIIKRFIQMKLQHNKSDKSDAKMIALYAQQQTQSLVAWEPEPKYIQECKVLNTTIALYFKQSTALKNKLHSLESKGLKGVVYYSVKRQVKSILAEIKVLESQLELLIKEHEPEMLANVSSISGIGKKTAMMLISNTSGFRPFESYKQVSSFLGSRLLNVHRGAVSGGSRISARKGTPWSGTTFFCAVLQPANTILNVKLCTKGLSIKGNQRNWH